ncbi:MAG: gamma-glutamylcyclotransferase [Kineosporiaceae bacterium]
MAIYAAYGSNLDPERMAQRAPHSPLHGTGWLLGWRLSFGGDELSWQGPLSTVVEDPGHQVYVVLYDLTPADEKALDEWEGVEIGLWTKIRVRVSTLDGEVTAWVYVLNSYEGGLPSARYLGMLADAAEAGGAPTDYVDDLRARACNPNDPSEEGPDSR